ncbi:GMC oxidoreductase [Pelagibius sp.]|uniref:GMC oxidoreductase n=1 Tax=Pelagibius sp. TaxID=1931238 RepID=UPI00261EAFEC|nr:GMC family oxidoreductase [Pelagibius sp.]
MTDTSDIANRAWDVIVIGTGMGGATLGHALAKAGKSVLFCEQGRAHLEDEAALRGDYPETGIADLCLPHAQNRDALSRAGRYGDLIEDRSGPRRRRFVPFIGAGTGGSSALYGMALERFLPEDFRPREKFAGMLEGAAESSLPERWPIAYEELAPYYTQAESLYRVRGGKDPLRGEQPGDALQSAPPLTAANQELFDFLSAKGVHPYRLPSACEFLPDCKECQGFLCTKPCKNDSARICLAPALRDHGAVLLDQCRALRLEATKGRVDSVICRHRGRDLSLKGATIVLAAGALQSPLLLLRSRSPDWPQGIANEHDLVGRNLMRHCVDLYALKPKAAPGPEENHKEIAFNDFYGAESARLGSVQSFGRLPPPAMIVDTMEQDLREGPLPWLSGCFRLAKPFIRSALGKKLSRSVILASLLEDLPYRDNRVLPMETAGGEQQGGDAILHYRLHPFERTRIAEFRKRMTALLKPYDVTVIKQAENNQRIAHVCGTCRFGDDPEDSVLDRNNRAHGLENLYVVDSSFFPSSGGTNPSLTIAANALRVADMLQ